jgi:hypothetical protein
MLTAFERPASSAAEVGGESRCAGFLSAGSAPVVLVFFREELGFGRHVARLLTRLVTRDGGLPQGAATSLAMANLLLWKPLDVPVAQEAKSFTAPTGGHYYFKYLPTAKDVFRTLRPDPAPAGI